jgi:two-component system chemotaxis sensor kinase CheA
MQNMLRPIVESAGYQVVGSDHDGTADVVIVADGAHPGAGTAARVISLRANPGDPAAEGSIYRYDRAGLLMALSAGAGRGQ